MSLGISDSSIANSQSVEYSDSLLLSTSTTEFNKGFRTVLGARPARFFWEIQHPAKESCKTLYSEFHFSRQNLNEKIVKMLPCNSEPLATCYDLVTHNSEDNSTHYIHGVSCNRPECRICGVKILTRTAEKTSNRACAIIRAYSEVMRANYALRVGEISIPKDAWDGSLTELRKYREKCADSLKSLGINDFILITHPGRHSKEHDADIMKPIPISELYTRDFASDSVAWDAGLHFHFVAWVPKSGYVLKKIKQLSRHTGFVVKFNRLPGESKISLKNSVDLQGVESTIYYTCTHKISQIACLEYDVKPLKNCLSSAPSEECPVDYRKLVKKYDSERPDDFLDVLEEAGVNGYTLLRIGELISEMIPRVVRVNGITSYGIFSSRKTVFHDVEIPTPIQACDVVKEDSGKETLVPIPEDSGYLRNPQKMRDYSESEIEKTELNLNIYAPPIYKNSHIFVVQPRNSDSSNLKSRLDSFSKLVLNHFRDGFIEKPTDWYSVFLEDFSRDSFYHSYNEASHLIPKGNWESVNPEHLNYFDWIDWLASRKKRPAPIQSSFDPVIA